MRVGTCPHMLQCVCRLEDSLQNSHHVSHGIELRLSGLVRGAVTHWAILTTFVWQFKGRQHSLHCELSVVLKMSSQGPGLWLITQVCPVNQPSSLTPLWLNVGSACLAFFCIPDRGEEWIHQLCHRLEVLPVPQEGELGDLGVRSISSPFLLYKAQRLPGEGCGPTKP